MPETGSPRVGSMRMSSGPSARKLKPRSGSSSCGEDDAEIEEHAAARAAVRVRRHERPELGKRRVEERKPQFVGKALRVRPRWPADRGRARARDLLHPGLENACRVAAAPECRIDIVTTCLDGQCRERLLDKHGCVLARHGRRPTFSRPRQIATSSKWRRAALCRSASCRRVHVRLRRASYKDSESSSEGRSVTASSLASQKSRRVLQRVSSHSSKRLP